MLRQVSDPSQSHVNGSSPYYVCYIAMLALHILHSTQQRSSAYMYTALLTDQCMTDSRDDFHEREFLSRKLAIAFEVFWTTSLMASPVSQLPLYLLSTSAVKCHTGYLPIYRGVRFAPIGSIVSDLSYIPAQSFDSDSPSS